MSNFPFVANVEVLAAQLNAIGLLSADTAATGTPPAEDDGGFIIKSGWFEGLANSSSQVDVGFAVPFPNGCIGALTTASVDFVTPTEIALSSVSTYKPTTAGFTAVGYFGDTGVGIAIIAFSWLAIGW